MTWKGKSDKLGISRKHREINFYIQEPDKLSELFEAIGLEQYARQEKYRTSWTYQDWRFDLDEYPGMPPYLEIEGSSEESIQDAVITLELTGHQTSQEGERMLIQKEYNLDWYNMSFSA